MKKTKRRSKYGKYIKAFLIIWGLFLLGILVLATVFLIDRIKNDDAWYKAQIENTGKPIIYEQHYYPPTK